MKLLIKANLVNIDNDGWIFRTVDSTTLCHFKKQDIYSIFIHLVFLIKYFMQYFLIVLPSLTFSRTSLSIFCYFFTLYSLSLHFSSTHTHKYIYTCTHVCTSPSPKTITMKNMCSLMTPLVLCHMGSCYSNLLSKRRKDCLIAGETNETLTLGGWRTKIFILTCYLLFSF